MVWIISYDEEKKSEEMMLVVEWVSPSNSFNLKAASVTFLKRSIEEFENPNLQAMIPFDGHSIPAEMMRFGG